MSRPIVVLSVVPHGFTRYAQSWKMATNKQNQKIPNISKPFQWSCYLCSTNASPGGSSCLLLLLGIDGPCSHCTASSPPHGSMSTDSEGAGGEREKSAHFGQEVTYFHFLYQLNYGLLERSSGPSVIPPSSECPFAYLCPPA